MQVMDEELSIPMGCTGLGLQIWRMTHEDDYSNLGAKYYGSLSS